MDNRLKSWITALVVVAASAGVAFNQRAPASAVTGEMRTAANDSYQKQDWKAAADLKSPSPTINCTTCHRGEIKPALNLPVR